MVLCDLSSVAERGGSVVVMEKQGHLGGNSAKASSGINSMVSPADREPFLQDTLASQVCFSSTSIWIFLKYVCSACFPVGLHSLIRLLLDIAGRLCEACLCLLTEWSRRIRVG